MAKTTPGNGIQDIRGKSGNHVYSNWRGRGYLRSKAINPANPRSSAQATLRSSMPRFSTLWSKALTDAQRTLWNEYAKREGKIKGPRSMARLIIPPPGVIGSGFNMFVRNNILLQTAEILVPPAYLAVPPDSTDIVPHSPTSFAGVWNYGWAVHYLEHFDDEPLWSTPDQWTPPWTLFPGGAPNSIRVTNVLSFSGIHCAQLLFPSAPVNWALYSNPNLAVDGAYLDYYARVTQNNISLALPYVIDWPFTAVGIAFRFGAFGSWSYQDGAVWKVWGAYLPNVWYHVRLVLFNSTKTWAFYINNMAVPAVSGISFANPIIPSSFYLQVPAGAGSIYIDDLSIEGPVTTGVSMTWTDPVNAPVGSRIRVWLRSYGMNAHLQQVGTVALGEEAFILSQVRTAQGRTVDISNLPGQYKIQLDSVSPEGRQSAPSNLIEVEVPSS